MRTIVARTHILTNTTTVAMAPNTNCEMIMSSPRCSSPFGGGFSLGGALAILMVWRMARVNRPYLYLPGASASQRVCDDLFITNFRIE